MRRTTRLTGPHDPRLADFRMLVRSGRSRQEIARLLGLHSATVKRWARVAGLRLPSQAEAMKARWADPDFRAWRGSPASQPCEAQ